MNSKEIDSKNTENEVVINKENGSSHHHHSDGTHHHHGDGTHRHHHHHNHKNHKDYTSEFRKYMFNHVERMRFIRKWGFIATCIIAAIVIIIVLSLRYLDRSSNIPSDPTIMLNVEPE